MYILKLYLTSSAQQKQKVIFFYSLTSSNSNGNGAVVRQCHVVGGVVQGVD